MSASRLRRPLLILAGLACLLAAFLAGGAAKSRCVFPFCRGYPLLLRSADQAEAPAQPAAPIRSDTLDTSLYAVAVERLSLPFWGWYGSVEVVNGAVVVASGDGDLYRMDDGGRFEPLPFRVPLPKESFGASIGAAVNAGWFSVKDLEAIEEGADRWRLLASHHHWDPDARCFTLRVSEIVLDGALRPASAGDGWATVFETQPCLPIKEAGLPFAGAEAGGRIEALSPTTVLVSVGDHQFNGIDGPSLPQDPANGYGKIHSVDLVTREATLVSRGHRNPQGLAVDAEGRIWSTEHGPRGGDELNAIRPGTDYGWPAVTYGTNYGTRAWPFSPTPGTHEGFAEPVYAWVPSVAVSQLLSVRGDLFPLWRGDLLVGSLAGQTLFRVRVREGRVVLAEPIPLGARVRDLVELPEGAVAIVTDDPELLLLRPAE